MAYTRKITPRFASGNRVAEASWIDAAAQPTIAVTNDFHGGCIDPGSLVIDNTIPSEPGIQLTPYVNAYTSQYWGWGGRFSGMNGKRPKFRPTDAERYLSIAPDEIYYSYDLDGPYYPSNPGTDQGAYHEYQFASAFTQDQVYIWQQIPTTPNVLAALVSSVLASPYGHRIQADLSYATDPTPGVIGTIEPDSPTMWWGKSIPNAPIYGFRIADDSRAVAGGKRRCISIGGQHAGEWSGTAIHRRFVEWLISAQDGGDINQQAAFDLLGSWEFLIFPLLNPLGMYVGMHRGSPESSDGQTGWNPYLDPNRVWYSGGFSLESHALVRAAMSQHYPGLEANLALDWHSRDGSDVAMYANADATTCPEEQALLTAARGYDANWQSTITVVAIDTSFAGWMDSDFAGTGDFTLCPVTVVVESGTGENFNETENGLIAAALGRGLLDRTVAGDYPGLITGSDETHGAVCSGAMSAVDTWAFNTNETHQAAATAGASAVETWAPGYGETHGAGSVAAFIASEGWLLDYAETHGAITASGMAASDAYAVGADYLESHQAAATAAASAAETWAGGYSETHAVGSVAAFIASEGWVLNYAETHASAATAGMAASDVYAVGSDYAETHGATAAAAMSAVAQFLSHYSAVHQAAAVAMFQATPAYLNPMANTVRRLTAIAGDRPPGCTADAVRVPVFNQRDNAAALVLFGDGVVMGDLGHVSRVLLRLDDDTEIDSAQVDSGVISWAERGRYQGAEVDVLALRLGGLGLPAGTFDDVDVVVFDSAHPNGLQIETGVQLTVHA
jgi:hypothetical protein